MALAYAPARPTATTSPRRSGGSAATPTRSVDSQIGPSTVATSPPADGSTVRLREVSA